MPMERQFEDKLTPAARQALDELVSDYRAQLLLRAGDSASRLGELREISVHDIVAAVGRQQRQLFGMPRSPMERLLTMYAVVFALIGGGAFIWFLAQQILTLREFGSQVSLMVAAMGFSVAVGSYLLLRARQRRFYLDLRGSDEERLRDYHGMYLAQWSEIEVALRKVAAVQLGESAAGVPISRLIEHLAKEGRLSDGERVQLLQFLELRNALAHGRSTGTHEREIMTASREAGRLLGRLQGMF